MMMFGQKSTGYANQTTINNHEVRRMLPGKPCSSIAMLNDWQRQSLFI